MKNKSFVSCAAFSQVLCLVAGLGLVGCAGSNDNMYTPIETPTVDYIETLDVYSAPHKDSFLNQLAMNYRSYAIYNARTSGYPEMGELFAQKAIAAFSGELPFPETLDNWPVENEQESFELYNAYNDLLNQLKNDASMTNPELAAEAQAKFDCSLINCNDGASVKSCTVEETTITQNGEVTIAVEQSEKAPVQTYYPDTRNLSEMRGTGKAREGVIIVNNVNVPEHLINPVPVQPLVFNQNIYGGDKTMTDSNNVQGCTTADCQENTTTVSTQEEIPMVGDELVTREEFINMMMAMRQELAAINARLDEIQANAGEKTMIKVQQIPLEPKQHVMEEVFEIRFDFDKSTIKPEYEALIKQLATATQSNKNIKVSVVGHTDTMGSKNYNYALGGRRAEAVQKMLIKYGIPASQIVAVSAGEEDLAVPTPDGVANAANRRVRVVKEVHYTEPAQPVPVAIVEEYSVNEAEDCGMYGCVQQ